MLKNKQIPFNDFLKYLNKVLVCSIILYILGFNNEGSAQTIKKPPLSQNTPGLPEIVVPSQPEDTTSADKKTNNDKKSNSQKGAKSSATKEIGTEKSPLSKGSDQAIFVLVNDEPITGYEISQRQNLMSMGNPKINQKAQENFKAIIQSPSTNEQLKTILNQTIKENPGKSREQIISLFEAKKKDFAKRLQSQAIEGARKSVLPNLRKDALDELIDERLKLQEAKKLNVVASDDEVNKIVQSIAEKNKMTDKEFTEYLKKTGADINVLKNRFKATMSWQEVIRRLYGQQVSITERDVDRFVEKTRNSTEEKFELNINRITISIPSKLDQKQLALQMSKAEELVQKNGGCEKMSVNASSIKEAKFENLGPRLPETIPEPTRTLLLNSKDGELLPPIMAHNGIEIWAVCSRKIIASTEEKRQNAQAELRQKEFEVLAKKHLNDLRQDAAIEYR